LTVHTMDLIYLHADNTMDSSNSSFVFIIITLLMLKNGSCLKATEWLTCQCTHNALALSDYQSLFMELKIFPKMLYNRLSTVIKGITLLPHGPRSRTQSQTRKNPASGVTQASIHFTQASRSKPWQEQREQHG
jgi:hypothetical protein